jgi:hypothetical protein
MLFEDVYGPDAIDWEYFNIQERALDLDTARQMNKHFDLVLVGGGGLLWDKPGNESPTGWQFRYDTESLLALDVPLALYALGFTYFPHQDTPPDLIQSFELASEKAEAVSFRDWFSYHETADALGINANHPRDHLSQKWARLPCPSMRLADLVEHQKGQLWSSPEGAIDPVPLLGPVLGVVPAFDQPHLRWGEPWPTMAEESVSQILKNMRLWHKVTGGSAIIIEHLDRARHVPWLEKALGIETWYGNSGDFIPDPCDCDEQLSKLLTLYATCDEVWSMRKHGVLLPAAVGTRVTWVPDGAVDEVRACKKEWQREEPDWDETYEWIGSLV